MRKAPRPLVDVLRSDQNKLKSLRRHASFLQQTQAAVDAGLPAAARGHVRVADCNDQRLLLLVDSGSWATRLRFEQDAIRRSVAARLKRGIPDLEIRIRPSTVEAISGNRRPRHMSDAARQLVTACATYVDNPALTRALRRLAAAGRDKS